jgi:hypothetical protein
MNKILIMFILLLVPILSFAEVITTKADIWETKGYKFHKALYPDGTMIVTCLNGEMQGLQGVKAGEVYLESTTFEWTNEVITHYYPCGIVKSFPNAQSLEVFEGCYVTPPDQAKTKQIEEQVRATLKSRFQGF